MDWNNDFQARVNFAANVIGSGSGTSRRFDGCFENSDGDEVVTALYRRTVARPDTKLAANIWRYLCRDSVEDAAARLAGVEDLAAHAAESRRKARAAFEAMMDAKHGDSWRQGYAPC